MMPVNIPGSAKEAWREFQHIALRSQEEPELIDSPDYRAAFKVAHARFWRRYMEENA